MHLWLIVWHRCRYHLDLCKSVFGEGIYPDVVATNLYYGGKKIAGQGHWSLFAYLYVFLVITYYYFSSISSIYPFILALNLIPSPPALLPTRKPLIAGSISYYQIWDHLFNYFFVKSIIYSFHDLAFIHMILWNQFCRFKNSFHKWFAGSLASCIQTDFISR